MRLPARHTDYLIGRADAARLRLAPLKPTTSTGGDVAAGFSCGCTYEATPRRCRRGKQEQCRYGYYDWGRGHARAAKWGVEVDGGSNDKISRRQQLQCKDAFGSEF